MHYCLGRCQRATGVCVCIQWKHVYGVLQVSATYSTKFFSCGRTSGSILNHRGFFFFFFFRLKFKHKLFLQQKNFTFPEVLLNLFEKRYFVKVCIQEHLSHHQQLYFFFFFVPQHKWLSLMNGDVPFSHFPPLVISPPLLAAFVLVFPPVLVLILIHCLSSFHSSLYRHLWVTRRHILTDSDSEQPKATMFNHRSRMFPGFC